MENETLRRNGRTLPAIMETELLQIDWQHPDVLVGTVRSQAQFAECMRRNYYYIPENQLSRDALPLRYAAIYCSHRYEMSGIRFYGEIIRTARIRRRDIPFPMNRDNGETLYYAFVVRKWKPLPSPILYAYNTVYEARLTHRFLLFHTSSTYELFAVHSAAAFRLLYAMKTAGARLRNDGNLSFSFVLDERHMFVCQDRTFYISIGESPVNGSAVSANMFEKNAGKSFYQLRQFLQK